MSILGIIGGQASDQAALRLRLDTTTRQISTGQKSPVFGGLAPEARRAIDLRGEVERRETYAGAADRALGRTGATQTVLSRLQEIAGSLSAEALRATTIGTSGVDALAQTARSAMEEVAALLNTRHGGEYLFGGSDVANPPVPGAATITTGPLATAIAASVATLDPVNAATVLADSVTAASAATTTPFSAFMEGPGTTEAIRAVQVADGERVAIGVFANRDQDGEVAASWGRELLRGLAVLAAVTPAQAAQDGGWGPLMDGVTATLSGASAGLAQEQGMLGAAEQRLTTLRERHKDTVVALRTQLAGIEEIDITQASADLTQLRLRLEASYEVTGTLSRLSLASLIR